MILLTISRFYYCCFFLAPWFCLFQTLTNPFLPPFLNHEFPALARTHSLTRFLLVLTRLPKIAKKNEYVDVCIYIVIFKTIPKLFSSDPIYPSIKNKKIICSCVGWDLESLKSSDSFLFFFLFWGFWSPPLELPLLGSSWPDEGDTWWSTAYDLIVVVMPFYM